MFEIDRWGSPESIFVRGFVRRMSENGKDVNVLRISTCIWTRLGPKKHRKIEYICNITNENSNTAALWQCGIFILQSEARRLCR